MSLVIEQKSYDTLPEGQHNLRITKIEDLGEVPISAYTLGLKQADAKKKGEDPEKVAKTARKLRVYVSNAAGESTIAQFTASLHVKAKLTEFIEKVTGSKVKGSFDVESLVGYTFDALVEHSEFNGKTYANVTAVVKGSGKPPSAVAKPEPAVAAAATITDADIPF